MPKTTHINEIMQNFDNLTLAELLVIRAKVDTLIEEKLSSLSSPVVGSYQRVTSISTQTTDSDIFDSLPPQTLSSNIKGYIKCPVISAVNRDHSKVNEYKVDQFFESQSNPNNSLEAVIDLVDEWMADESDYDTETYSYIEPALNRNQLSL